MLKGIDKAIDILKQRLIRLKIEYEKSVKDSVQHGILEIQIDEVKFLINTLDDEANKLID